MKDTSLPSRTDRRATWTCIGIAAAAGLAWVFAAPPMDVWPLGWVALAPTLWLIDHAPTARRASFYAWVSGTVSSLGGFRWIVALLTDQAHLPLPLGILGLVLLASYNGLVFFFVARAVRALRKRKWPMAVCAPLALVTFEKLVPMVFPYFLAITQSSLPIAIQIADITGPYGVSALIAISAGAIVDGTARRKKPGLYAAIAIGVALGYGAVRLRQIDHERETAPHIKIALIPSGVQARADHAPTHDELVKQLADLQHASAEAEAQGADLVVWSEASYPLALPHDMRADLPEGNPWRIREGFTVPAVIGALVGGGHGAPYNSALLLERDGSIPARHDKVHRVLGSEYNPILEMWPGASSWMPQGAGFLAAGDAPHILDVTIRGDTVHIGAMICFEDILPVASLQLGSLHPNLLVNLTEDSWFGPDEPWQHLGLAVFRAVEVRADLVRAVNLGPSSFVDAGGRVIETAPLAGGTAHPMIVFAALVEGGHTVYCMIGDTFAWLCAIPTLFLWLYPWLRRRSWWRPVHAHPSGDSGAKPKRKSVSRKR
ncbi:MAG TPA: apolipoprotein N-acyltransferase [Kofleriaceae bacterium]|nr:apolipoprotein N-acyltransferase [Kofleriaceae bacterium]